MTLSLGGRWWHLISCPVNLSHNSTIISVIFRNSYVGKCRAILAMLCIIIYLYYKPYLIKGKCYDLGFGIFFPPYFELDVGVLVRKVLDTWREDLRTGIPVWVYITSLLLTVPNIGWQNLLSFPVFSLFILIATSWLLHCHPQVNSLIDLEDFFKYWWPVHVALCWQSSRPNNKYFKIQGTVLCLAQYFAVGFFFKPQLKCLLFLKTICNCSY